MNVSSGGWTSFDESVLMEEDSLSEAGSLVNFRAENLQVETDLFSRISALETRFCYGLPPQNKVGDYESPRTLGSSCQCKPFSRDSESRTFRTSSIRTKILQDRLQNLLLGECNIDQILELSPYENIRREAFSFLEDKVEPVSGLNHPYQKDIMEGSLNYFLNQLETQARQSEFYRDFYRHFTDEEFRRSLGLPLPSLAIELRPPSKKERSG